MGAGFAGGWRNLLDQFQRFVRTGLSVYLVVKNFPDDDPVTGQPEDYIEVGVPLAATGADGGVSKILIDPPPGVQEMSLHNIGLLAGRFNLGSIIVYISNTFVQNQQLQYSVVDNVGVWRDRNGNKAVGIYYNNRMMSIESVSAVPVSSQEFTWKLLCNAPEQPTVQI